MRVGFAHFVLLVSATAALSTGCRPKHISPPGGSPDYVGTITGSSFQTGAPTRGELVRFTLAAPPGVAEPPEAYIRVDSVTQFTVGPRASLDWNNPGLPDLKAAYVRVWFHADRHISVTRNEIFGTAKLVSIEATPYAKAGAVVP